MKKGGRMSERQKRKISETEREGYREGRINYWKGKLLPLEMKRKISKTAIEGYRKGKIINYWKGKKMPKKIIRKANETKELYFQLGILKGPNKGKKLSELTKAKISRKLKERYKAHPYLKRVQSELKKKYYEENPEARKNLLDYASKKQKRRKTSFGIYVKSEG